MCERFAVEVLTLHGSAARGAPDPQDVDLAVLFGDDHGDLLGLLTALGELMCIDEIDVMDLRRASVVARARGLAHGAEPLYECRPGAFAEAQMAALSLEMDFAPMRREQLRVMAGR